MKRRYQFKDLKKLREDARDVARNILKELIKDEIKPALLKAIQQAYDEYTSRADVPYKRREDNGGLLDESTIEEYFYPDGLSVRLRQTTTSDTGGQLNVDIYVTQGNLYNWSNSEIYGEQPFPRDFYEYARQDLDGRLQKIFKDKFEKRGLKTEDVNLRIRI